MGHKEIGFIGSVNVTKSIMDRYLGYLRTMMLNGLEVRKEWILENISVVSFDNDILSKLSVPQLTTIAHDTNYMAKKVADLIIKQIKEPDKKVLGPILANGKIIYRESVKKIGNNND